MTPFASTIIGVRGSSPESAAATDLTRRTGFLNTALVLLMDGAHDGERRGRRENDREAPVIDRPEGRVPAALFRAEHGGGAGDDADQSDRNMQADDRAQLTAGFVALGPE